MSICLSISKHKSISALSISYRLTSLSKVFKYLFAFGKMTSHKYRYLCLILTLNHYFIQVIDPHPPVSVI
jgi:hypothetical protein